MATVQKKNTLLRIVIPLLVSSVAFVFIVAMFYSSMQGSSGSGTDADQAQVTPEGDDGATSEPLVDDESSADTGADEATDDETTDGPADAVDDERTAEQEEQTELRPGARYAVRPAADRSSGFAPLGSLAPDSEYLMQVSFDPRGAGISEIKLSRYWTTKARDEHLTLQHVVSEKPNADAVVTGPLAEGVPMALTHVKINDAPVVALYDRPDPAAPGRFVADLWRETGPGRFEAVIVGEADQPVLRIERSYELAPGSYEIVLRHRLVNLSDGVLNARLYQYGPVDLDNDQGVYGGDRRRVRFGYLTRPKLDPAQRSVVSDHFFFERNKLAGPSAEAKQLWPNDKSKSEEFTLSWAAMTNRYFAFAVHAPLRDSGPLDFPQVESVHTTLLQTPNAGTSPALALRLHSPVLSIQPGATASMDVEAYAGPLDPKILKKQEPYRTLGLGSLVVYRFGCTWCTFQWLAKFLIWFLGFLHAYVLFDWALAIIALVAVVRGLLHPLTKRSQISIARFSKQMQGLKPKLDKIQEKYADDPKRRQAEQQKLMREQGVNPAQVLGCLPMFLQMPVWIALYAMLFYAIDLRQESAFFGFFQLFNNWAFLGDLAQPDRFIYFGETYFTIPLAGEFASLNILPILLGVIFYIQQKYMTPTQATLTKEQETQQKIMKIMMVVMFPVFLYNAPSGLTLYILTSSTTSIFESRYIRRHINEMDEKSGGKPKKKRGPSFMERIEARRKAVEADRGRQAKRVGKKRSR
jgi:YidC/Oxa1 family membrane protein insertase